MADTKAVFVDGNSLFYMLKGLGIGKTKDPVLFEILTKEVGKASRCFGRPVLVLWSDQVKDNTRAKYLEKVVGYELVSVEKKEGGEDDLEIIKRIEALSPEEVSEIVLVSCDVMDFLPCLKAKIALGIKVWLVASRTLNSRGKSMLTSMVDLPSENIQFVELGEYSERIIREPWVDKPRKERPGADAGEADILSEKEVEASAVETATESKSTKFIKLSLEVSVGDLEKIMNALSPVLQIPVIKSALEIK